MTNIYGNINTVSRILNVTYPIPNISLEGSDQINYIIGDTYTDQGIFGLSSSDSIEISLGFNSSDSYFFTGTLLSELDEEVNSLDIESQYIIQYLVTNIYGNIDTVSRILNVTYPIPNISLEGSDQINYIIGDTYTDQGIFGLSSSDSIEISLGFNSSDSYFFTGTLLSELDEEVNSLDIESQYIIQYLVTNIYGNIDTVSRILNVSN